MTEPTPRPPRCRCPLIPSSGSRPDIKTGRYARAMSLTPLGDDATERQRAQARIDNQTRAKALREERAVQLAEAIADWNTTRDRLADNPPALAALDLHKPDTANWVCCATCVDGGDPAEWQCDTYKAIRQATS